ncbi:competence/damage-inducible protein A [Desulforamulus aquiferis]|uniref:Putative competence-damage inducible protein n=1 Tax=Desulforamulus aquiferis TaxID=1397668 RepID=A0AAW7ZI76_9FIRM|nr:competence/damage-inducible protein A [Desulforamulus aquiferis]MDO7788997.1 competence/damage-inducible protein A [Desulforamulus aquiferis]
MKAEILSVGTELLLGDIVNTNAQFLSRRLAEMGILVYHQAVVGDNSQRIIEAFHQAFQRSDIVITTGGLGPTKDDLTRETTAEFLGLNMKLDNASYLRIKALYDKLSRPLTEAHIKQVYFPEGAVIFQNSVGTAPGSAAEKEGKIIINLPGPPGEMTTMFEREVLPYLTKFQKGVLVSKVLRISGMGEASMAGAIEDIINSQSNPTVAPYAKENDVIVRITARAGNKSEAEELIAPLEDEIRSRLKENIYGQGNTSLEEETVKLLLQRSLTLSVAESCTGGLIAARLINYPGVSRVLLEASVTYSNKAKKNRLGVREETLSKYGAVSEETAREMAAGVAKTSGSDIGLAVTGIAGPEGDTSGKPVGLVYLALYILGKIKVQQLTLTGARNQIRNRTAITAIDWLRREILVLD